MDVFSAARDTINGSVAATLSADRYATVRSAYSQAIALVPAGDKVLAAVDYPSLLLRDGVELNTLDIAGSTSPSPHLPYFLGTAAKLSWFSTNGYKYIVAADPSGGACLYSSALQNANVKTGGVSGAWAPYLLDWFQFLQDLSSHTHTVVGPLVVYKL
jgi:hypothetical protein